MHQSAHRIEPEKTAFELLYRRHMPSLLIYVQRQLLLREDAEDLLVEVFQAAFEQREKLAKIDDQGQAAWLRRVAHNKLVDFYRRAKRRFITSLDEHEELLFEDEEHLPEQVALRTEEYAWLHAYLERLPKTQQEVIRLHFAAGLRCVEIARLLNKRDGAIRMLLARALNNLRSLYEQQRLEEERL